MFPLLNTPCVEKKEQTVAVVSVYGTQGSSLKDSKDNQKESNYSKCKNKAWI